MVEIWNPILTKLQVRRGVDRDTSELISANVYFIDGYNDRAQPFLWTKTPDQILGKAIRRRILQTRGTARSCRGITDGVRETKRPRR